MKLHEKYLKTTGTRQPEDDPVVWPGEHAAGGGHRARLTRCSGGLQPGDEILAIAGEVPRDVIRWQILTDDAEVELAVQRDDRRFDIVVSKHAGEPLGAEVHAALFDKVQTCDNHCEFCFIHQLPKGCGARCT